MNLGVGGWSTHQGLRQLERDVLTIQPQVVTIYYGWNDHWTGFGIEDTDVTWINSSRAFKLLRISRLAQLFSKTFIAVKGEREQWPLRVSPEDFRANLTKMVNVARTNGITPVLLTAPTSHVAGMEPAFLLRRHIRRLEDLIPLHQQYLAIVREVAADRDSVLCDLAKEFETLPADDLRATYFQEDGIHLRPAGDSLLASILYSCLEEHDLLPDLVVRRANKQDP